MSQERTVEVPASYRSDLPTYVFDSYIKGKDQRIYQGIDGDIAAHSNSNRGAGASFSAEDAKARVVVDFAAGKMWTAVNSTTWAADPTIGPTVSFTATAHPVAHSYASSNLNWVWQDWITYPTTFRFRYHFSIALRVLPSWAPVDLAVPSIDKQYIVNTSSNSVSTQGDAFPTSAVYKYHPCSYQSQQLLWALQQPDTHTGAMTGLVTAPGTSWQYNTARNRYL